MRIFTWKINTINWTLFYTFDNFEYFGNFDGDRNDDDDHDDDNNM